MIKFVIILMLMLTTTGSFCQDKKSNQGLTFEDYMKKSKNQKLTGFIMLGTGAVLIAIAAPGDIPFDVLPVFVIGSSGLILGSIPLFIASRRNKRKAMEISASIAVWKHQGVQSIRMNNRLPVVSLKIRF